VTVWFTPSPRPGGGPPPRAELLSEMTLRDIVLKEYR
jgi:hypothetical protein